MKFERRHQKDLKSIMSGIDRVASNGSDSNMDNVDLHQQDKT